MALGIQLRKGRYLPTITCDGCGEIVADWNGGLVTFELQGEDGIRPAKVYHKGRCDPGGPGRRPADAAGWMDLAHYFPILLWNYGMGEKSGVPGNGRQITIKVSELPNII